MILNSQLHSVDFGSILYASLLQEFFHSHNSFRRDEINGYPNLFSFIINPPRDYLEKVEELVNLAFQKQKLLRYREQFGFNKRDGN